MQFCKLSTICILALFGFISKTVFGRKTAEGVLDTGSSDCSLINDAKRFASQSPDQKIKSFANCFSTYGDKYTNISKELLAALKWNDDAKDFFVQRVEKQAQSAKLLNSDTPVSCCTPFSFFGQSCWQITISADLPLGQQIWTWALVNVICTFLHCGHFQSTCDSCPAFTNQGACCSPFDLSTIFIPWANEHHCCQTSAPYCSFDNLQSFQGVGTSCGAGCGACCKGENCDMTVADSCEQGTFQGPNVHCDDITCEEQCGISDAKKRKKRSEKTRVRRIIGGDDAVTNGYPWVVQIRYINPTNGIERVRHGVIIDRQYVLVRAIEMNNAGGNFDDPADCPNAAIAPGIRIVAGAHFYDDPEGVPYSGQCIHYGPTINRWAIINVSKPIDFNEKVGKICLPPGEDFDYNFPCTLTGWGEGWNNPPNPILHVLQELSVQPADPFHTCDVFTTPTITCLYSASDGTTCQEDWAAPVQCKVDDIWYLYGLVYAIASPCFVGTPKGFNVMKVDFELAWINGFL